MSQPAVTRLPHELEEMLCCRLFERTNRGPIPTGAGQLLIRHATVFLAGIDKIYEDARSLKIGITGALRVGVATGGRPDIVPSAIGLGSSG
jgi:DNA-binding transcriptional LysR family regulator